MIHKNNILKICKFAKINVTAKNFPIRENNTRKIRKIAIREKENPREN